MTAPDVPAGRATTARASARYHLGRGKTVVVGAGGVGLGVRLARWLPWSASARMHGVVVEPDGLGCDELGGEELPAARPQEAVEFDPKDVGSAAVLAWHVPRELDDEAIPAT